MSATAFWRIRRKLAFENKKVLGGFFGNCLRMQKPQIKFAKCVHWDMALGCGPRSRKHSCLKAGSLGRPLYIIPLHIS